MAAINFPLGIAEGKYFCNRVKETKRLRNNIENCTHTVLISPRRYGKTSLAYRAISMCEHPYARVDLYMTTSAHDIERAILRGVDHLLNQVSNNAELLLGIVKDYIKSLRPSFEAGADGLKIKLEPIASESSALNVCEGLQVLDGVLKKKQLKAVLLVDEFQEVERVAKNQGIEGAIRHVAQEAKNFSIVFSGSNRHLLLNMFNDRNKPLYRLCDEIRLKRIKEQDYKPFLDKFCQAKWGNGLSEKLLEKILEHSEQHPYYFNAICHTLFMQDKYPKPTDVDLFWDRYILSKQKDLLGDTKDLGIIHKKLLVAISNGINQELTGKKFLSKAELSGASVVRALEYLQDNDFIEKENDCYILIDPLLKGIIRRLTYF